MRQRHDLQGQRFGLVIALSWEGLARGSSRWKVRCDCGAERVVLLCNLKAHPPKTHLSCGGSICPRVPAQARYEFKDETGSIYGDWEVLERRPNARGNAMWRCRCESCGAERVVPGIALRSRPPLCDCQKVSKAV